MQSPHVCLTVLWGKAKVNCKSCVQETQWSRNLKRCFPDRERQGMLSVFYRSQWLSRLFKNKLTGKYQDVPAQLVSIIHCLRRVLPRCKPNGSHHINKPAGSFMHWKCSDAVMKVFMDSDQRQTAKGLEEGEITWQRHVNLSPKALSSVCHHASAAEVLLYTLHTIWQLENR